MNEVGEMNREFKFINDDKAIDNTSNRSIANSQSRSIECDDQYCQAIYSHVRDQNESNFFKMNTENEIIQS